MVQFNELGISDDKSALRVRCTVDSLDIYSGMYIKSIYVEKYDNSTSSGVPSDKAICIFENTGSVTIVKSVRVCLNSSNPEVKSKFGMDSFDGGLFYVIVECDGSLGADASSYPCGYDSTTDVGVVLDWLKLYDIGMQHVARIASECLDGCADMSAFDNFIVLWNAMKLAVSACDYTLVKKLYDKMLRYASAGAGTIAAGCGCSK